MKKITKLLLLMSLLILASCHTPTNISYFQDSTNNTAVQLQAEQIFRLRPEDKVYIVVSSKDPNLSSLFTLSSGTNSNSVLGGSSSLRTNRNGGNYGMLAYTVDSEGNIEFPVLGPVHAAGLTRTELAHNIQDQLINKKLVLDAIVTVEYVNLSVSVLGSVSSPGRQDIDKDHYTVLDAIEAAGDLTITGQREDVKVLRNENGQLKCYTLNLCSTQDIVSSPAYYLQQNDIVYVTPNDVQKRTSTVNGNTLLTPSFWISICSFAMTTALFVINIVNK